MKPAALLALAAGSGAFVLPPQNVFTEVKHELEAGKEALWEHSAGWAEAFKSQMDAALGSAAAAMESAGDEALNAWESIEGMAEEMMPDPEHAPFWDVVEAEGLERPGKRPHKIPLTAWELISKSNHTSKFAEIVKDMDDIVELLNGTDSWKTVFVPLNEAFEKIPKHGKDPSKEFLQALIRSHISPGRWTSRRLFGKPTIPTVLRGEHLSSNPDKTPQRLSVKRGLLGVYINGYNRVVYKDFIAKKAVLHGMRGFNLPPPPLGLIVTLFPQVFSTFELGLHKSGLGKIAKAPHAGATVFAPVNGAFVKLGWKANAFLFSRFGRKYLKGLLAYHVVANLTLYSDTIYGFEQDDNAESIPKGRWHVDLPTLLHGEPVSVDIGWLGPLRSMHVNHFSKAVFQDAIALDGNLHAINRVLIPPHKKHDGEMVPYDGGELSVEDLMARLEPFVDAEDCDHDAEEPDWNSLEL